MGGRNGLGGSGGEKPPDGLELFKFRHSVGTGQANQLKTKPEKIGRGMSNPLPKRLYTLSEAANYLGRTLWSMRELVWAGKIPIVRDGKRIFVDIKDLESYIAKNKVTYV